LCNCEEMLRIAAEVVTITAQAQEVPPITRQIRSGVLAAIAWLALAPMVAASQDADPALEGGTIPAHWLSESSNCAEMPDFEVHQYNPDLYILRQSPCANYEKPFLYLIFGQDRAMLLDTGADSGILNPTISRVIHHWLARNGKPEIELVVTHTHEHGDHIAGDTQIQQLDDPAIPVTFVAPGAEATSAFFGIADWPEDTATIDLGERKLDVLPLPGHSAGSVAFYDRQTGILFTGDSLYPGRIYVNDPVALSSSIDRLAAFAASHKVTHVLGTHVEQSDTPFVDYPMGTVFQPDEHELALSPGAILELQAAVAQMRQAPRRIALRDFSIWPMWEGAISEEEWAAVGAYMEAQEREKRGAR